MKFEQISKAFAFVAAASLAACGGGGGATPPPAPAPQTGANVLTTIVGIGDSLTAGFQSDGFLGAPVGSIPNPLAAGTPAAALGVPPGQESGFWSQLYMAAKGANYGTMANQSTSPLPLIAAPGLGNQIVPANPAVVGTPFGQLPTRSNCDTFNAAAYALNQLTTVRENPKGTVLDLAVPGITLHEALTLTQPPVPTCNAQALAGAPLGMLAPLLSESGNFYPVLGGFGPNATMLSAATSLHPTLTTVWLGANDLLHYALSGGAFTGSDGLGNNVGQVQQDMVSIISTLQKAGSQVVVANLPDILQTPFFAQVAGPPSPAACSVQTFLVCELSQFPAPIGTNAAAIDAAIAALPNGPGANGIVTEAGLLTIIGELTKGVPINQLTLDPAGPGSGLGQNYLTQTFAASVQQLNDTLNTGIANAASQTKVPLVDVHTIFAGLASGNFSNQFFAQAASINPGKCCTLAFGGGLVSFDGLHPSNTGYAFIASAFVQTINTAFGNPIAGTVNPASEYNGVGAIPFPDPYAQH